ncbi:MAG: hypothetical protein H7296_04605 [Bacteroidia bacterium]|nr:hypothetical protein [Bacteroidia bacterium]
MKKLTNNLGILISCSLILLFSACNNHSPEEHRNEVTRPDTTEAQSSQIPKNDFEKLRNQALTTTPEKLNLHLSSDQLTIYGIVMDWEMGGTTSSTVCFKTGDASIYISSGGGVIGGGKQAEVNAAAKLFLSNAQECLDKAKKTRSTPLPEKNQVIFYILTTQGIYTGNEFMKNIENNTSQWQPLFDDGNRVIASLRRSAIDK